MSAADRIASGVAKHLSESRPPKASTRDLIEEAFRRGYELGRSVRLPTDSPAPPPARTDTGGASWPELTTTPIAPAVTQRPTFAASTSSSSANAPPADAIRAIAIQNNGARAPGAAISTPQPTLQASSTWSASSDDRTRPHKPAAHSWTAGFFIANATTALGTCPLECRDHRGTTTPSRPDRERTELNYHRHDKVQPPFDPGSRYSGLITDPEIQPMSPLNLSI